MYMYVCLWMCRPAELSYVETIYRLSVLRVLLTGESRKKVVDLFRTDSVETHFFSSSCVLRDGCVSGLYVNEPLCTDIPISYEFVYIQPNVIQLQ